MVGGEYPTETPLPAGFRDFLKWRRQHKGLIRAHKARGESLPKVFLQPGDGLEEDYDSVTWCGHASVLTRLGGQAILSDPIWSARAARVVRRLTPPAPAWDRLPPIRLVTISHNHYDHLDARTLRRLRKTATFLVPKGVGKWFRRRRFPTVSEFSWWETKEFDGIRATFVPTQHFSGRSLWDRNKTWWGGWVLEGHRHRVWHTGDTGYFEGFKEIGSRFRRIDVACVPIGAYEPRWFMKSMHVNPDEAGQAFLDARARYLLPMHWGTFRLSDEAMDEPPRRIRAFFQARKLDAKRLWLSDLGQTRRLD